MNEYLEKIKDEITHRLLFTSSSGLSDNYKKNNCGFYQYLKEPHKFIPLFEDGNPIRILGFFSIGQVNIFFNEGRIKDSLFYTNFTNILNVDDNTSTQSPTVRELIKIINPRDYNNCFKNDSFQRRIIMNTDEDIDTSFHHFKNILTSLLGVYLDEILLSIHIIIIDYTLNVESDIKNYLVTNIESNVREWNNELRNSNKYYRSIVNNRSIEEIIIENHNMNNNRMKNNVVSIKNVVNLKSQTYSSPHSAECEFVPKINYPYPLSNQYYKEIGILSHVEIDKISFDSIFEYESNNSRSNMETAELIDHIISKYRLFKYKSDRPDKFNPYLKFHICTKEVFKYYQFLNIVSPGSILVDLETKLKYSKNFQEIKEISHSKWLSKIGYDTSKSWPSFKPPQDKRNVSDIKEFLPKVIGQIITKQNIVTIPGIIDMITNYLKNDDIFKQYNFK